MVNYLSVEAAKQLIDFISMTNYKLAPLGDGIFSSSTDAIAYVESVDYDKEQALSVCFDTQQGNYWESAQVTFNELEWFVDDLGMGGQSAKGDQIQAALEAFRLEHNPTCAYYPVELVFTED
jgi:hypothetical protein|tara:strand:- start:1244 stop:1609 length:366 start_codon:yes stop_codon:yes gene_type:complete